ncbi:LTA synthase family protein [Flavicella sediminum]|uniref:LTA synthase family protein n=1 Tax=Flavicella sediminum TaxID=2585141 RepID=UPI001122D36B|nr:alkaline phosphatase family protein [Flavicella sediminum]
MSFLISPNRFSLLKAFTVTFLIFSFVIRSVLYVTALGEIDFSIITLFKIFGTGLFFDLGSISYFILPYAIYLLLIPTRFHGCKLDRWITYFFYSLLLFCVVFSFLSEITFWQEYQRRFNFIAVDYLLYTYEVLENINESYPIPLLVGVIVFITFVSMRIVKRKKAFENTFCCRLNFVQKLIPTLCIVFVTAGFYFFVQNKSAEIFENRFENELAKSGIHSFFAAYQSNELSYDDFYEKIDRDAAFQKIKKIVTVQGDSLQQEAFSIRRTVFNKGEELKPNVIFIGLESLNARYLQRFGNAKNWTPTLDSLYKESIAYSNLYAVGTRTIRGLEAITLAIPPTPGRSIVKRKQTKPLYTIGSVFKEKGYSRTFFYGGDGYFDNMNSYFGNNGFDVVDRRKKHRLDKQFPTERININDDEVTFENAWGVCDEDIYNKLLKVADAQFATAKPFFNFVMNNSNHQPYTYPEGVVEIPSGTSREGAVKYADIALKRFFEKAKKKPWYKNTVFVIMSDHCAYSAGRTEINVESYHIPAMLINVPNQENKEVEKLCSQMDIFPTLFGYLNWTYTSNSYGQDIRKTRKENERAFVANYRRLGLLKKDQLLVLNSEGSGSQYYWQQKENELKPTTKDSLSYQTLIAYYQTAYDLYKNGGLQDHLAE